jgi:maleate isomerase
MHQRDYGRFGRIGIVTPQANPTVEPEIQCLLPAGVSMLSTRCTSGAEARQRFTDYFERLGDTLRSFDTLKLDALGFACTASTYLVGKETEQGRCAELEARYGFPVITAAGALEQALEHLGAVRVAIACPYPQWLFDLAVDYWKRCGFNVVAATSARPQMGDTRAIYEVRGADATNRILNDIGSVEADVFMITGTGMPGLQAIVDLQTATGKPALNSNLALAWRCLKAAGAPLNERSPVVGFPWLGGWKDEISRL